MPPKRRNATAPAGPKPPAKKRQSKLAKENDISSEQEAEIQEAFSLFAIQHPEHEDEKQCVLKRDDVRRCLIALNTPPSSPAELAEILSTLDPTSSGFVPYSHFLAVAALKLHARTAQSPDAASAEVEAAFTLFTRGEGETITLKHLQRVARELREDVSDATLRDMIKEATGGQGAGVGMDDFEEVMRRAGVFG